MQIEVPVPSAGEKELPPLSDAALTLIHAGLEIANQGAVKSMAAELIRRRKEDKKNSSAILQQ